MIDTKNDYTSEYFGNNAAKIRRMSDLVLKKIGYVTEYPDEFYSLAGEVFLTALDSWDGERKFESFLYTCLSNRFKSQITRENAQKRGGMEKTEVSINQEIGEDLTLEDTIGTEQRVDRLSPEMIEYVQSLNGTQKNIYLLMMEGYEPREIQEKLGITSKVYNRELRDARSYGKIRVLNRNDGKRKKERNEETMNAVANERTDVTKTVSMLIEDVKDGTLRDDNPLQRATDNWNLEMKGNLIVTALNGFGIPEFVICQRKVGDAYVEEIIDGLQRFSAFAGFVENGYRISKKVERPFINYKVWKEDENGTKVVDEDGLPVYEIKTMDVRGKKFQDLPRELQKKIEGYGIHCDTYLNCSNEDVEYHIRRLNSSRSMNHSQRGLTFVGSTLAAAMKMISRKEFFLDTYKTSDFRNGSVQRLIFESVMLINHENSWVSAPEKIGAYLSENSNLDEVRDFGAFVDRVDEILDDETRKLFNMRDSFIWFRVFNDFSKLGFEDEKFNDFLKAFDENLKEKVVDDVCFADLCVKSTKDLSIIRRKIDYLEALMCEFLGIKRETVTSLRYGNEFKTFVDNFCDATTDIVDSDDKTAIKALFALRGEEDLSDSHVQELINEAEASDEDMTEEFEDVVSYVQDFVDDWGINVEPSSSILKKDKFPALIRLYKYSCESEVEGNRAQNWFVNLADQEEVNPTLIGNYQRDWGTLYKKFSDFVTYEHQGVA